MATLEKEDFWGKPLSTAKTPYNNVYLCIFVIFSVGCELKKGSVEVKFNPEFEDSELSEVEHKLILSQVNILLRQDHEEVLM